jgi:citrate/tricarballylate utilization protein
MPAGNIETPLMREGERVLRLCNACRYCQGFCAVFPALERRSVLTVSDVNFLANLCHNCGECYYACPYTPPHEYALNLPKVLADIRVQSYSHYAYPRGLSLVSRNNAIVMAAAISIGIGLMAAAAAWTGRFVATGGDFFAVIPHQTMVLSLGLVFVLSTIAIAIGALRFWRELAAAPIDAMPLLRAIRDVLRLENLRARGDGCPYPRERLSQSRVWFHHATFYGFFLCFASTTVAAFYHFVLNWLAPYGYFSLPVVLGTLGGVGLLIGPAGLFCLKQKRDAELDDLQPRGFGDSFIILLFLTSLTGMLLLVLRNSPIMSLLLIVHLGVVIALFAMLPYSKFVHGVYRSAALLRNSIEQSAEDRRHSAGHTAVVPLKATKIGSPSEG